MSQGQYAPYPRKPIKEIDLAVISEAFKLIWTNFGPFATASVLGYFIPVLIIVCTTFAAEFAMGFFSPSASSDPTAMMAKLGPFYGVMGLMYLGMFVILAPFAYAMTKMTLKAARNQPVTVSDAFSGFAHIVPALATTLTILVITIVLLPFCCVPSLLASGLLMLSLPLVVDRGMGPIEAMKESVRLLRPHMWMALLLMFLTGLLAMVGMQLCYIPGIYTWPLMYVVPALVYRDFAPPEPVSPVAEPSQAVYEQPAPREQPTPEPEPPVEPTQEGQEPS